MTTVFLCYDNKQFNWYIFRHLKAYIFWERNKPNIQSS